jgi:hypothetical protein
VPVKEVFVEPLGSVNSKEKEFFGQYVPVFLFNMFQKYPSPKG